LTKKLIINGEAEKSDGGMIGKPKWGCAIYWFKIKSSNLMRPSSECNGGDDGVLRCPVRLKCQQLQQNCANAELARVGRSTFTSSKTKAVIGCVFEKNAMAETTGGCFDISLRCWNFKNLAGSVETSTIAIELCQRPCPAGEKGKGKQVHAVRSSHVWSFSWTELLFLDWANPCTSTDHRFIVSSPDSCAKVETLQKAMERVVKELRVKSGRTKTSN
jgi:hypothetical protein